MIDLLLGLCFTFLLLRIAERLTEPATARKPAAAARRDW